MVYISCYKYNIQFFVYLLIYEQNTTDYFQLFFHVCEMILLNHMSQELNPNYYKIRFFHLFHDMSSCYILYIHNFSYSPFQTHPFFFNRLCIFETYIRIFLLLNCNSYEIHLSDWYLAPLNFTFSMFFCNNIKVFLCII